MFILIWGEEIVGVRGLARWFLSHSNSVMFYRCHGLDLGEITWVRHKTSRVKHYRCGYIEKCCVYGNLGCSF